MIDQSKTAIDPDDSDHPEGSLNSDPVSRSQRKRDAEEITDLGQLISELPESDLKKIPLDERVSNAVHELRKIRSFGARKRQLHYLGKVLRKTDLEPIRAALRSLQLSATTETRLLHSAEQWRQRLLADGDTALTEFLKQYPSADRQQLRQITRNHAGELQARLQQQQFAQNPGATRSSREIFKIIRATLTDPTGK